jgi:hypothetical protein
MEPVDEVDYRAGSQTRHAPDAFGSDLSHGVSRSNGSASSHFPVINYMHAIQVVAFLHGIHVLRRSFPVRFRHGAGAGGGAGVPGKASRGDGDGKGKHASGERKCGSRRWEVMLVVVARAMDRSGEVGDSARDRRRDEAAAAEQASHKRHGI